MAKKKTLVCIHVMPSEIEMLERFMIQYHRVLHYLNDNDDVTLKVTLNLNPELTDWEKSELKQNYFITRFAILFNGIKNINEIILDTSCWGTTQQKRESIKLDYDQFVFCDSDIMLHEHLLRHQLDVSYQINDLYVISPSIPRWWDESWDILVHSGLIEKNLGNAHTEEAIYGAATQPVDKVVARQIPFIKFGCGMHTMYSKQFWNLIGIPESFGGYGPEDTFAMNCANLVNGRFDILIKQFVLDGIYITEDYINNKPSFADKIVKKDVKKEFYEAAKLKAQDEVVEFLKRIQKEKLSNPQI